jgi:hypothetical protein
VGFCICLIGPGFGERTRDIGREGLESGQESAEGRVWGHRNLNTHVAPAWLPRDDSQAGTMNDEDEPIRRRLRRQWSLRHA